jgi:hypothetical protein
MQGGQLDNPMSHNTEVKCSPKVRSPNRKPRQPKPPKSPAARRWRDPRPVIRPPAPNRIPEAVIAAAIPGSRGILTRIAKAAGCNCSAVQRHLQQSRALQEAWEDEVLHYRQHTLALATTALDAQLEHAAADPAHGSTPAVLAALRAHGATHGYQPDQAGGGATVNLAIGLAGNMDPAELAKRIEAHRAMLEATSRPALTIAPQGVATPGKP